MQLLQLPLQLLAQQEKGVSDALGLLIIVLAANTCIRMFVCTHMRRSVHMETDTSESEQVKKASEQPQIQESIAQQLFTFGPFMLLLLLLLSLSVLSLQLFWSRVRFVCRLVATGKRFATLSACSKTFFFSQCWQIST